MLPDSAYTGSIRRGVKSDVFWNYCVVKSDFMRRLLKNLFPSAVDRIFLGCRKLEDHDERAAFICALTARSTYLGTGFLVDGGWDGAISLPPEKFLQPWAKTILQLRCADRRTTDEHVSAYAQPKASAAPAATPP
jgi:hypothetical protein